MWEVGRGSLPHHEEASPTLNKTPSWKQADFDDWNGTTKINGTIVRMMHFELLLTEF